MKDDKLFSINIAGNGQDKSRLNKKEYYKEKQGEGDLASYTKIIENIDSNSFQINTLNILETIDISINNKDYKLIFNNRKMFLLNNKEDQHFEVSSLSSIKKNIQMELVFQLLIKWKKISLLNY